MVELNNVEFEKRIEDEFNDSKLSRKMRSYFELHQFDEWIDIENDINNGFINCCCKEKTIFAFKKLYIHKFLLSRFDKNIWKIIQ